MTNRENNATRGMVGWMIIGIWLLVFGLLILFFQGYLGRQRNPNQNVNSALGAGGVREVTLQRNRYGHYNVSGRINGHRVEFLLDTGATQIAVPASVAKKIGLKRMYETMIETANGTARAYGTRLQSAGIGDIQLHNLPATITTGMSGDVVLLGMGFLKHIEFTQRGDVLILRQYP